MNPPSSQDFIRKTGPAAPSAASNFEHHGAAGAPAEQAPPQAIEPVHKHRAMDLFLRGAISAEQMKEASASLSGFERIIGKADYLPAFFLEQGAAMSRATCKVKTTGIDYSGEHGTWFGTAFLITPNVLVTNNHVLNSKEVAAAAECIFNYQITPRRTEAPTKSFRLNPDRLFLTSPAIGGLDYTFVWIDGEPGREYGFVPIDRSALTIAPNEYANIVSHPNGNLKVISIKENEVKWQDEMVVHYTSDTEPGGSGSGVSNNNWQLVALHHASKPSQVPGFDFLNEGIKFSAIALDLERRARASTAESGMAARVLAIFNGTDENIGFFGMAGRAQAPGGSSLERVVNSYAGTDQDLDVGFWNVEWLSNRYEEKAAAVAQVIKDMKLDIWCLEESSPNGAAAVIEALKSDHGLEFEWEAAEPEALDSKQSCTVLWNKKTVAGKKISWGEPIETWLSARSTEFDGLGLEAVHGKIFDRYPALFEFETVADVSPGKKLKFHLVPLHLKAMDEGSLRRRMASRIIAAAIKRRNDDGYDSDYIVGGDFNAELASGDFAALSDGGMVALSADDEANGAFTYVKRPHLSLIDHIYLSPNLAADHGPDQFFIVAAEASFPDYIRSISDHRPVLMRLSMNGGAAPPAVPVPATPGSHETGGESPRNGAMDELRRLLPATVTQPLERRPSRARTRETLGFDPAFLGDSFLVGLPGLGAHADDAVTVDSSARDGQRFVLPYTHFSVAMNGKRRLPYYSAVNIDGNQSRRSTRNNNWRTDDRIDASFQAGNDIYHGNDLDKGHMTRRLDPVWGDEATARRANDDTFYYTNACPQHKDLNQREWSELEDYVLDNAKTRDLRVSVLTGPVFNDRDISYRGIGLPEEFWKIVAVVNSETGRLSVTAYLLSQRDMISEFEFAYGQFRTYQVPVSRVAEKTRLDFGTLSRHDPLNGTEGRHRSFENVPFVRGKRIASPADLVL